MGVGTDHDAPAGGGEQLANYHVVAFPAEGRAAAAPRADEESVPPAPRPTRRRFLKWSGALVIGATTLTGKLVGFAPSVAEAAPFNCVGYNWITQGNGACFNCTGVCDPFESCCRAVLNSPNPNCCCGPCPGGPYACNPQVFRAENYCQFTGQALCCCGTC